MHHVQLSHPAPTLELAFIFVFYGRLPAQDAWSPVLRFLGPGFGKANQGMKRRQSADQGRFLSMATVGALCCLLQTEHTIDQVS
jgi:hypothetical protein